MYNTLISEAKQKLTSGQKLVIIDNKHTIIDSDNKIVEKINLTKLDDIKNEEAYINGIKNNLNAIINSLENGNNVTLEINQNTNKLVIMSVKKKKKLLAKI